MYRLENTVTGVSLSFKNASQVVDFLYGLGVSSKRGRAEKLRNCQKRNEFPIRLYQRFLLYHDPEVK